MFFHASRILLTVCAFALFTGCAPRVSVNTTDGLGDYHTINTPPAPGVITAAMQYVTRTYPANTPPDSISIGIKLPGGASDKTCEKVARAVGAGFSISRTPIGGPYYEVVSVNVRGRSARVDVLSPFVRDGRNLIEVRLNGVIGGWKITGDARFDPLVLGKEFVESRRQPQVMMTSTDGGSMIIVEPVDTIAADGTITVPLKTEESEPPKTMKMIPLQGAGGQPVILEKQDDEGQPIILRDMRAGGRSLIPVRPAKKTKDEDAKKEDEAKKDEDKKDNGEPVK